MGGKFRDRYLQYDDPIADHRMLWRAHMLPHIMHPLASWSTAGRRDSRFRAPSKTLPFESSGTARRSHRLRVNAGSRLALCQNYRARQLKP